MIPPPSTLRSNLIQLVSFSITVESSFLPASQTSLDEILLLLLSLYTNSTATWRARLLLLSKFCGRQFLVSYHFSVCSIADRHEFAKLACFHLHFCALLVLCLSPICRSQETSIWNNAFLNQPQLSNPDPNSRSCVVAY